LPPQTNETIGDSLAPYLLEEIYLQNEEHNTTHSSLQYCDFFLNAD